MTSQNEINTTTSSTSGCPTAKKCIDRSKCVGNKSIKFRCDFPSLQVDVMLARGWIQAEGSEPTWSLWWCETSEVRLALDTMKLRPNQRIPHYRNHHELTRKNYLCRNLKRQKKLLLRQARMEEAELCDSMPITFELPSDYHMLVEEYHKLGGTWIVKPAGRSQGRGIFLFRKLKDLTEWMKKQINGESTIETYVVQKYVDDPYLLAGRKFDLRIYVLVTSFRPLKVWLAREGFARLAGVPFSLENIEDSRVHLTNMAIQLKIDSSPNSADADATSGGEQVKPGFKWSLLRVREYLTARHGVPTVDSLLQRMAGIIMASLQSVQSVIMQTGSSFELYGYDILLDERLTPWLIEINASPSLTPTDDEDRRLKFDLLDDLLNVLDFEGSLTGREIRIGGFDLLWNDGPVWNVCPNPGPCCPATVEQPPPTPKRLNIFLGAKNDRARQLRRLRRQLRNVLRIRQ